MTHVRNVRLDRRRILLDGEPTLVMSGEVHYFRLARGDWADRLDKLAEIGCTAVATYIPWLVHETSEGALDLVGRTAEHRDVAGFLDLAAERDLLVIARPGPFVMAELKNEGIPFRIYNEYPHVRPVGWDGAPAPTPTLDYLAPDFLAEVDRWYAAIMPMLAERLVTRGGPVAAVQLDNEIGMLSWVSNSPELTDGVLADFGRWSGGRWSGMDVRSPAGPDSLALHHDISRYFRDRYARYIAFLRERAEAYGVHGVPYLINVHGTGGGRGRSFPIGISQLYQGYRGQPQLTSGSDHYLGDLTLDNLPDLYVINAFMAAVHDADQPLTSLEFEVGTGDYGEDMSVQVPPSAADLKLRLSVAQGNRLINYYLFAGGSNPLLDTSAGDGTDRIAITGERHGYAAPVNPEGETGPAFAALRAATAAVNGSAHLLADMDEEHDNVVLGFVPDHYLTEYVYPGDTARAELVDDLARFRGMGSRAIPARALLLAGFSFPAVDVQDGEIDPDSVLLLASATTLAADTQQRLAQFVVNGGRLLLAGLLPRRDVDGTPCAILADALGLKGGTPVYSGPGRYPSVRAGWSGLAEPEVRVDVLQPLAGEGEVLVRDVATGAAVGVDVQAGAGRAIVLTCDYPCRLGMWTGLLDRLGARPRHTHDATVPGVVVTSTADGTGQRLLHLVNVGTVDQDLAVWRSGVPLFGGRRVALPARSGLMLPEAVRLDASPQAELLAWATCELAGQEQGAVSFRRTGVGDVAVLETPRQVVAPGAAVRRDGRRVWVEWLDDPAARDQVVRLTWSH